MSDTAEIATHIRAATGLPFTPARERAIGGGCINATSLLEGDGQRYFVKRNDAHRLDMFAAEAAGLAELARANAVRVPQPVCFGTTCDSAFLVLEYIALGGRGGDTREFGRRLAALHRVTGARYGWHRDNTIGATPQINTPADDWIAFWRERRLGYQLELAARNGGRRLHDQGARLLDELDQFFTTYTPAASLLHGDLWGGNYAFDEQGNPVIFDPAVYYGDRETDLAMTELFGGFGADFYRAYAESYPLDAGYDVRKTLYNLYHVLNHFNLFGDGYLAQAARMIERLSAEIR